MQPRGFWTLSEVTDDELQGSLRELLRAGGRTEARIVAHLAEVETRRLHLRGAPSLFHYCRVELGLSESEAWYRICAARAGRKFPVVFELLEQRELHLTAIALLANHLTPENHRELLSEACGQTKQQILEMLARRWPKADVSRHLRRIPSGSVAAGPSATLEPRSAETYCLQLNVSRELKAKLDEARDLMSHANPNGDLAVVVDRALELLIHKLKARRFGQTSKQQASELGQTDEQRASELGQMGKRKSCELGQADANASDFGQTGASRVPRMADTVTTPHRRRHVPNEVRRQVAERDGERCRHVGPGGRRCEARAFLQLHHEQPWALGGADSVSNLRLLCRAHNRLEAELELGVDRVEQAVERRRTGSENGR
jgi:hypothetical protein